MLIVSMIAASIFFLQSCKEDDNQTGTPFFNIEGDPSGLTADINGKTESYVVRSNRPWKIVAKEENVDWVKVFPNEGDDDGIFKIIVSGNEGFTSREANFAFVVDGVEQPVLFRVEQDANTPYITLPAKVVIPSAGGSFDVAVTSNIAWNYSYDNATWLGGGSKTDNKITLTAERNQLDARSVVLTVTAVDYPGVSQTVTLEQSSGSVILEEHFDWLAYGSAVTYLNTPAEKRYDSWTDEEKAKGWTVQLLAADNTPLLYSRPGFVKLGKGSYGGDIVSPKLSAIAGTVNLKVTFKAAAYISAGGTIDPHILNVEVLGGGTASKSSFDVDNIPNSEAQDNAGIVNNIWSDDRAYTFNVTGATADTQIRFVSSITAGGITNRFFLDDIKVEIVP